MDKLTQLYEKGLSRRNFLAAAGVAGTAALIGCNDSTAVSTTTTPTTTQAPGTFTDADVLNFALNLEYLEAEFYLAAAGATYNSNSGFLAATDIGTGTSTTGAGSAAVVKGSAAMVTGLTAPQQQVLSEIAFEEQSHVRFLRAALGSAAVARPRSTSPSSVRSPPPRASPTAPPLTPSPASTPSSSAPSSSRTSASPPTQVRPVSSPRPASPPAT